MSSTSLAISNALAARTRLVVRRVISWLLSLYALIRRNARMLGAILILSAGSKVVGAVREIYISSRFGITPITDTFFAVQQIPMSVTNYIGGAFTLAFVPHYVALKKEGESSAFTLRIAIWLAFGALLLTAFMGFGRFSLVPLITGLTHDVSLTSEYSLVLCFSFLPILINGLAFAMLHGEGKHAKAMTVAAMPPVVMLGSLILWLFAPSRYFHFALPWSFLVGAIAGGLWGARSIWKTVRLDLHKRKAETAIPHQSRPPFLTQLGASSIENIAFNLNILFTVHFAALTGPGGVATYTFAQRLAMVAYSGVVSPLMAMANTRLARADKANVRTAFLRKLLIIAPSLGAISLFTFLMRTQLIRIVYQRGAFTAHNTAEVAAALAPFSLFFLVMALNVTFAQFFFVVGRGQVYTVALLIGYVIENILKSTWGVSAGVPGIIISSVIGEGLALLGLAAWFALKRDFRDKTQLV